MNSAASGADPVRPTPGPEGLESAEDINDEEQLTIICGCGGELGLKFYGRIVKAISKVNRGLFAKMARGCRLLRLFRRGQAIPTEGSNEHLLEPEASSTEEETGSRHVSRSSSGIWIASTWTNISSTTCHVAAAMIVNVKLRIARARRQRNSRAPIFRLPETVIRDILIFAVTPLGMRSVKRSLALSHICHGLRYAAFVEPRLWTSVSSKHSLDLVTFCLQRSKLAGLLMTLQPLRDTRSDLITQECFRVRWIHLNDWKTPGDVFPSPPHLPVLESLAVSFAKDAETFATPLDNCPMQKLQCIVLHDAPLAVLQTLWRPTLTDIAIFNVTPFEESVDLHFLVLMLEALPLKTLRFQNSLPRSPTCAPTVVLRQLVILRLGDWANAIVPFLRSICLPELESLDITVNSPFSDNDMVIVACTVKLLLLTRTDKRMAMRTAVIDQSRPGLLRYRAWPEQAAEDGLSQLMRATVPPVKVSFWTLDTMFALKLVDGFRDSNVTTYLFLPTEELDSKAMWKFNRTPGYRLWSGPELHLAWSYLAKFEGHDRDHRHPIVRGRSTGGSTKRSKSR